MVACDGDERCGGSLSQRVSNSIEKENADEAAQRTAHMYCHVRLVSAFSCKCLMALLIVPLYMKASASRAHSKPSSFVSNDASTVTVCPALTQCSAVVSAIGRVEQPLLSARAPTSRLKPPNFILPE